MTYNVLGKRGIFIKVVTLLGFIRQSFLFEDEVHDLALDDDGLDKGLALHLALDLLIGAGRGDDLVAD